MIESLIDILDQRARYQDNQQAYVFLKDGELESRSLTYGELERIAKRIASSLQSWKGERALLLYHSGPEFVTAFFGCLYAGIVAVPVYPPRRNQKLSRLLSIASDAKCQLALTTSPIFADIERKWSGNSELARLKWLTTDSIEANFQDFIPQSLTSASLAFLQYTSGSTGTPKGVMVTHGNIIHNQQLIHQAFGHSTQSIGVGWLPLFHDMGLIGHVLQPLYVGFPSILIPPLAFIQKPIRWLKAISKYRANTSGGPNFAYDLCVKKVKPEQLADLDLSSWDLAYSGAELIRAETLEQFNSKFVRYGFKAHAFYPCYGMAETTLFTTGGNKSNLPVIKKVKTKELGFNSIAESESYFSESQNYAISRQYVGVGRPYVGSKVIIVNPNSLTHCKPGEVGEIWVSGDSIASGYWNQTKATQETFKAFTSDNGEGPFLRTGDLGFLIDGELFVTGRIKDVIIIRGQNHYPQDIEATVQKSHIALRQNCGAAFTVELNGLEKLVIVQEVERSYIRKLDVNLVVGNICQAVAAEHSLQVYATVLIKTSSIPKTSSGKIRRHACKEEFLSGSLNILGDWSQDPRQKSSFRHLQTDVESLIERLQKCR